MDRNNQNTSNFNLWFDLSFFLRTVKNNIIALICATIIAGIAGYVAIDILQPNTYSIKAVVAVVSRNNTTSALNDNNNKQAMTRNVNMWNSNVLRRLVLEKAKEDGLSGINAELNAESVKDSNLLTLTATSGRAEDAYYILSTAIRNYHQIDANFDKDYRSLVLTRVTGDSIDVTTGNPVKAGVMAAGAVLCMLLGIVFIWTITTGIIHNEYQAKQSLDTHLYEALPEIKKKKKQEGILVTNNLLPSDYLESIDKLASRVEQHMLHAHQKILMVTSIRENEGKTTVATNLALNLAKRGNKVLIVDLDLRKPALFRIFEEERDKEKNLSSTLKRRGDIVPLIKTRTDLWNLDVLFQFYTSRDTDRILENSILGEQLKTLKEEYNYIILDTPPIEVLRDADVAAQMSECSMLVIREDYNKASAENDVIDQLEEYGAPCMCAVLNNSRAGKRRGRNSYGYHYGYGYGYGYGQTERKSRRRRAQ